MLLLKTNIIVAILICLGLVIGLLPSYAQEKYPTKNIELVISMGPGGVQDIIGRIFADELSKILKVPVAAINKPGATGTLAPTHVLNAKKDGYTLLINSISGMILSHFVLPDVPFDTLKDFIPISVISVAPSILYVKADSPLKSLEDLINEARKTPEKLTYVTMGIGSDSHYNIEQLQIAAKVKFSHIPFSGGEIIPAVLGGHADFGVTIVVTAASHLKARTIRGIVISGNNRIRAFPDIPTYAEKGYTQHYFINWVGFFAPAGIPRSAVDTLASASEKVIKSKDFASRVEKVGTEAIYISPTDFIDMIKKDKNTAETLVKQIGIKPKK